MSDYARANTGGATHFTDKDALTTGDANKVIVGAQFDAEFEAIVTAMASKFDSGDVASQAQAEAESSNTVLISPLRLANWSDDNAGILGDLQALADPNVDTILGWDDSATAAIGFTLHASLLHAGTEISVDHDAATNFVANEHIDHTAVTLTGGTGISSTGLGDISANRTINAEVADETTQGVVERATQAEVDAGSDTDRFVSPATLAAFDTGVGVTKIKTADESITSNTTIQDDDHLTGWNLTTGKRYAFEGFIAYDQSVGDLKIHWEASDAVQTAEWSLDANDALQATYSDHVSNLTGTLPITGLQDGVGVGIGLRIDGIFLANASTGGTLKLQWAQNTSDANATRLLAGSWIRVTQLD